MRKLIVPIFAVLLGIFLSCEDKKAEEEDPLVGIWEMTKVTFTIEGTTVTIEADDQNNETYIFNENGTYSYSGEMDGEPDSGSGTWTATGNKLTLIEDGETIIIDYSISGKTLTMSYSDTDDGVTVSFTIEYEKQ